MISIAARKGLSETRLAAISRIEHILQVTPYDALHGVLNRNCRDDDLRDYVRYRLGVPGRIKKADKIGIIIKSRKA